MIKVGKKIILASCSPRRHALLKQIGLPFEIRDSGVEELLPDSFPPHEYVTKLSLLKAETVAQSVDNAIIIAADTIVVIDNKILGKPSDANEAKKMLRFLSGCEHQVYTGFTLIDRPSNKWISDVETTDVKFRILSNPEIDEYVASGSPMDKAGSYGIQDDYGAVFVEKINGCFYNIVGFPLTKFYIRFKEFQQSLGII